MNIFYPLQYSADWLTYSILAIKPGTLFASALNFFILDTLKIFLLLLIIIFAISFLRTYLPPEKVRLFLIRKNKLTGHILAALLGIITPFCSCSAIPLFLGFIEAGVPLGVTFSFLIASPMINEIAIVMLLGMFGWKIALLYILSGLIIAIGAGIIIGRMNAKKLLVPFEYSAKNNLQTNSLRISRKDRLTYALNYTFNLIKKIWPYVLLGVGLGAWIHGYIPADFLTRYAGADRWYAVPLAVVIGIPLYANAGGVVPLVSALTEKGVALGTTLAFMMSVTALSLPEFLILKKVMRTKLIFIFAGIVGSGIMLTGIIFNLILKN